MKTFSVRLEKIVTKVFNSTIARDTPEQACQVAEAELPGYKVVEVAEIGEDQQFVSEPLVVVERCEGCRVHLFSDNDYECDIEGVVLCRKCWGQELKTV